MGWTQRTHPLLLSPPVPGTDAFFHDFVSAPKSISAGLIVGEYPEQDAKRFRRTEGGVCLITQAMIDKLGA